jgi:hypothetical protein
MAHDGVREGLDLRDAVVDAECSVQALAMLVAATGG